MRGLRKYLTPFARISPVRCLYYMNLAELSSFVMPVAVPEISVDLMSQDGLRVKVHCSVLDFVIWMPFLAAMTGWWKSLQMR